MKSPLPLIVVLLLMLLVPLTLKLKNIGEPQIRSELPKYLTIERSENLVQ